MVERRFKEIMKLLTWDMCVSTSRKEVWGEALMLVESSYHMVMYGIAHLDHHESWSEEYVEARRTIKATTPEGLMGVEADVDKVVPKKKFSAMSKKIHPDKASRVEWQGDKRTAFMALSEAYLELCKPPQQRQNEADLKKAEENPAKHAENRFKRWLDELKRLAESGMRNPEGSVPFVALRAPHDGGRSGGAHGSGGGYRLKAEK